MQTPILQIVTRLSFLVEQQTPSTKIRPVYIALCHALAKNTLHQHLPCVHEDKPAASHLLCFHPNKPASSWVAINHGLITTCLQASDKIQISSIVGWLVRLIRHAFLEIARAKVKLCCSNSTMFLQNSLRRTEILTLCHRLYMESEGPYCNAFLRLNIFRKESLRLGNEMGLGPKVAPRYEWRRIRSDYLLG